MKKSFGFVLLLAVLFSFGYAASMPHIRCSADGAADDTAAAGEARNFVLIFWGHQYDSKIADTVEFFFKNMLKPDDQLSILTPVRPYNFSRETRQKQTTKQLIEMTKKVLKRDFAVGGLNYKQTVDTMAQLVKDISGGGDQSVEVAGGPGLTAPKVPGSTSLKTYLTQYLQLRKDLLSQRRISEKLFLDLAVFFKKKAGKNFLYVFFQKESQYIPTREVMEELRKDSKVRFKAIEAFEEENTGELLDIEKVSGVLKDAAVTLHFIYVKPKERRRQGMRLKEFSNDVYGLFSRLTKETGGEIVTTSKPEAALKKTAKKMDL